MPIFLPVAGVSISLPLLAAAGAVVGLLSGIFGVGGGFLMTPILIMLGIPPTVAAASDSCQIVATSSSGMAAHFRLGNVDAKMGALLLVGGLTGAAFGAEGIKILRSLGEADLVIKLAYVLVLGSLGSYMFFQSLTTLRRGAIVRPSKKSAVGEGLLARLPWQMDFPRSRVRHSVLIPFFFAAVVGALASIMGVGGGFIMLPMMVYLLGMPTHVAVGTSLFQILFLCAGVTYLQADLNHTVDLVLALPLALSSAVGAQIGARLSRLMRGEQLMILLAILVLSVTGKMLSGLVLTPTNMLEPAGVIHPQETTPQPGIPSRMKSGLRSTQPGTDARRPPGSGLQYAALSPGGNIRLGNPLRRRGGPLRSALLLEACGMCNCRPGTAPRTSA